jgi:hypothetical protein
MLVFRSGFFELTSRIGKRRDVPAVAPAFFSIHPRME